MAVLKAAVLIYLAIVPVINAYPVAQTAENKGRGRSYPLIISQYSNVRNSKYNLPTTTTTTTTTTSEAPSVVILKEKDDVESPVAISDEKVIHHQNQEDEVEVKKVVDEQKTQDIKVEEPLVEDKKSQEEKTENKESDEPNLGSDSTSVDTKNESVLAASQDKEDSLDSKPVSPSNEEKIETTIKLEPEAQPESPVSGDVATLTNAKEEVQVTSLAAEEIKTEVSADKPAALEEGERPQMEATAPNASSASSADSLAKQEEPITKGEDVPVPVDAPDSTQQEPSTKTTIVQETLPVVEVETPTAESTDAESSRSAILKSEKTTSEFFEEDRSFKDRPEEILLAAFRQGTLDDQKILTEKLSDKNLDALNVDDIANEGIRLERDDKKTDKKEKEKEKEKYSVKASLKEKKPSKPIISSDDPVQEYDELTRSGRAKDETQSNTESTPVDKAVNQADDSEPVIIGLVPSNYPVILPSGESTLSDKIKPDETPKAAGEETAPVIIGVVPNNAPVILPNGESALSEVQPATEDKAAEAATQ